MSAVGWSAAADLPSRVLKAPPPPADYQWSGFYAGLHGGYGWADGSVDIGIVDPSGISQLNAAAGAFPVAYSFDRKGTVFGGQAGFNHRINRWLVGVEGDISATHINGSVDVFSPQCSRCGGPSTSTVSQDMDWFATVRGRLGYVAGQWLLFGTGGLALGHVKSYYLLTNAPFGGPLTMSGADSVVNVGWTAGAGVEYGWGRWSAKGEYLYYDLGDRSFGVPNPLAPPSLGVQNVPNFRNTGSILRVGLNYHL